MNYNNYNGYGYNNVYPYNNQGYNGNVGQPNQVFPVQPPINPGLSNYNGFQQKQNGQPQRTMCEFIPVSNINEVTSYIMQPNSTVIFKDVTNKILYEKKIDSQGISEIKAYRESNMDESNTNEFVKRTELEAIESRIDKQIEEIKTLIQAKRVRANNEQ